MKTRSHFLKVTFVFCLLLSFVVLPVSAQKDNSKGKDKKDKNTSATPAPTPTPTPTPAAKDYTALMSSLKFREIGPATMGGRIDDIEAVASDPRIIYVGTAAGGIFKSVNGGTSWTPIFDKEDVPTPPLAPMHPINWLSCAPNRSVSIFENTAPKTSAFKGFTR